VVFASVRETDAVNVRIALGLPENAPSFSAELSCARIATPMRKTVPFRCGGSTPATPKRGDGDAGTSDAGADADDGDDAAADATPCEPLH